MTTDTEAPALTGRKRWVALLFLALAWFAVRHGVLTDTWPAFLPGTDSTSITRYSGPWLTAAAVAVLGAGLSVLVLARGLTGRVGPAGRTVR